MDTPILILITAIRENLETAMSVYPKDAVRAMQCVNLSLAFVKVIEEVMRLREKHSYQE